MRIKNIRMIVLSLVIIVMGIGTLTACGSKSQQLDTPTNIVLDLFEKSVSFDKVENAKTYKINILKVVTNGEDVVVSVVNAGSNKTFFPFDVDADDWGKAAFYAQVQAVASDTTKNPSSEIGKSASIIYNVLSEPSFRIVKSIRSSSEDNGPGQGDNYVWIQLDPAQFRTDYNEVESIPESIEFKIYKGIVATGTPLLTKTIAGNSLTVTDITETTWSASAGFTFNVSSLLSELGDYTITVQAKAGATATTSSLKTYTYNYTAHSSRVTNTNAGVYSNVNAYTFVNPE